MKCRTCGLVGHESGDNPNMCVGMLQVQIGRLSQQVEIAANHNEKLIQRNERLGEERDTQKASAVRIAEELAALGEEHDRRGVEIERLKAEASRDAKHYAAEMAGLKKDQEQRDLIYDKWKRQNKKIADLEGKLERLRKHTEYYFRANDLQCEVSKVEDCGECAVCHVRKELKELKAETWCPTCHQLRPPYQRGS